MINQLLIHLPTKDLALSTEFFKKLGFTFISEFSDERMSVMILNDKCTILLNCELYFRTLTQKPVADAFHTTETVITLAVESIKEVKELVDKAVLAGARTPIPAQDHGKWYKWGFEDIDGHLWEIIYLGNLK